ncbi:MAG: pilus assembly protein [Acidimicrobiia bacterium]|nr:pilus assembly protein [Acidimicrobiia bacterium]
MVETALLLPLVLMLVFGIVEYGLAFRESSAIASAARAGARTASALPKHTTFAGDAATAVRSALESLPRGVPQELWVYDATEGTGLPDSGGFESCTRCVRFTWSNGDWEVVHDGWSAAQQNACAGDPDQVGVWLKTRHSFITGVFGAGVDLTARSVMRLEPFVVGPCAAS